jgi:hypothetical protein
MQAYAELSSPNEYEAPAIESTLDAEKLSREIQYAAVSFSNLPQ